MSTTTGDWTNRIVAFDEAVDPEQLLAHPENARRHPADQREALRDSLGRVGWVDVVKVNRATGHVVDGHARVEEAISRGVSVPVLYVDLDEDEERYVLATLDPIGSLAAYDAEVLEGLLEGVDLPSQLLDFYEDVTIFDPSESLDDGHDDLDPGTGEERGNEDERGDLLDQLEVGLINDPRHEVHHGEHYVIGDRHHLVIASVFTEWHRFVPLLTEHAWFVPYPGPHIPLSDKAETTTLVMVQPDTFIAGHLLDKFESIHGADAIVRA